MRMKLIYLAMAASLFVATASAVHAQSAPPSPPNAPAQNPNSEGAKGHAAQRVLVSGDVQLARVIKSVPPHYPDAARRQRIQGTVRVHTLIDKDGIVTFAKYVSGPKELMQAAVDAVNQWEFRPYVLNGNPVEVECVFAVNFNLR